MKTEHCRTFPAILERKNKCKTRVFIFRLEKIRSSTHLSLTSWCLIAVLRKICLAQLKYKGFPQRCLFGLKTELRSSLPNIRFEPPRYIHLTSSTKNLIPFSSVGASGCVVGGVDTAGSDGAGMLVDG